MADPDRPVLLVLASTYPRWHGDHEPGFVHELNRRLVERFDVIALVPDAPGADSDGMLDGVHVFRYRYAPRALQTLAYNGGIAINLRRNRWKWLLVVPFLLGQYIAARRLLRRRLVNAVHAHWLLPQGWIARGLGRSAGIPYLVTSHGGDLFGLRGRLFNGLKQRVAASATAMTVVSSAMLAEADALGLRPRRIDVLPMGVDLRDRFVVDPNSAREDDLIIAVGRLVPKKGLRYLLDVIPALAAARPALRVEIAGFGPEEPALREQAQALGIADRVSFIGATPQSALPALYRRASVLVAPFIRDESGDQEGLPVVLMEAVGCGCPIVAGDIPGLDDLLGDARDEIAVDPRDPDALALAILGVLTDACRARKTAARIRDLATARVDWSRIAQGYGDLVEDCITTARR